MSWYLSILVRPIKWFVGERHPEASTPLAFVYPARLGAVAAAPFFVAAGTAHFDNIFVTNSEVGTGIRIAVNFHFYDASFHLVWQLVIVWRRGCGKTGDDRATLPPRRATRATKI